VSLNLLLPDLDDPALAPLVLRYDTRTFDVDVGNHHTIGGRHLLSYGGNLRRNTFEVSLAPLGEDRTEGGVYVHDELFFEGFRLAAGFRVDKLGNLDKAVLSPRASVMWKPTGAHSLRLSLTRAFRAPSLINNFFDRSLLSGQVVDLARSLPPSLVDEAPPPFDLVVRAAGSDVASPPHDLREERIDALEIAYNGTFAERPRSASRPIRTTRTTPSTSWACSPRRVPAGPQA
jgi:outer membrane receptor protein involved in Fe transport